MGARYQRGAPASLCVACVASAARSLTVVHVALTHGVPLQKLALVSIDYERDCVDAGESSEFDASYDLPDGSKLTLSRERFTAGEVLFSPHLAGKEAPGIANMVFQVRVQQRACRPCRGVVPCVALCYLVR